MVFNYNYHKVLLCLLVFSLLTIVAYSQNFVIEQEFYGVKEGLAHREVYCAQQDDRGFMWFGTKLGLQRFDGSTFKYITKESHGLQNNEIDYIFNDESGLFWLINTRAYNSNEINSIDIFDPKTEKVLSSKGYFSKQVEKKLKSVKAFDFNDHGEIALVTENFELIKYNDTFELTSLNLENGIDFIDFRLTAEGNYWFSYYLPFESYPENSIELLKIDASGKKMQKHIMNDARYALIYNNKKENDARFLIQNSDYSSTFYCFDSTGRLTIDSLMSQKYHENALSKLPFGGSIKINFSDNFIWLIHSHEHLMVLDRNNFENIDVGASISQNMHATEIYFDDNNTAWICTLFGLHHVKIYNNRFKNYLSDDVKKSFPVRGITSDINDNLWVVKEAQRNLWKVDLKSEIVENEFLVKYYPFDSIHGNSFLALISSDKGNLIFSTSNYIVDYNPRSKQAKLLPISDKKIGPSFVWSIFEDKYGKIWYASENGYIGFIDGKNHRVLDKLDRLIDNVIVYQFHQRKDGTVWLATDSGIFVLDVNKNIIIDRYWQGGVGTKKLKFDNIYHLHEEEDGSFWLGTKDKGLVHWFPNQQTDNTIQYTRSNGLSNNTIYAVYGDESDYLWLSSDYGIMRFNKKNHQVQTYLTENGISHNEFNRISHHRGNNGTIYFGGLNGITSFNPKEFQADKELTEAPLVITDFIQRDKNGDEIPNGKNDVIQNSEIIFQHGDRSFRLEFKMLTYSNDDENRYAYIIEGVDQEWTTQKENSIRFSRLPYGNHILKIKGQSSDGRWSNKELNFKLSVLKPFYLKIWFILLSMFSSLLLIYAIYKWRLSQLKSRALFLENEIEERTKKIREDKLVIEKQAESLKSLDKIKSNFFANVSHELRTPLTLISGPVSSLLQNGKHSVKEQKLLGFIEKNTKQLIKLVKEILDLSKLENDKLEINDSPVIFNKYLKDQLAQFHSFASSDGLDFELKFNTKENLQILLDTEKFEKIIHNFLSNAMKFSDEGGKVILSVNEMDSELQISIKDEGRGIHPNDLPHIFDRFYQSKQPNVIAEGGYGIGLSICKEIAELLKGKVWVESTLGEGSIFYYKFPKRIVLDILIDKEESINYPSLISASLSGIVELNPPVDLEYDFKKSTILVVEDNIDLRSYLQILLHEYNVINAENGQNALEILNKLSNNSKTPDLIISDLMMPVMDGFSFLEKLKSDDRWRHLPVIMLTAKARTHTKIKALRIGVDDYLLKPFQEDELKARIENLLHNYRNRLSAFADQSSQSTENSPNVQPVMAEVDTAWLEVVEDVFNDFIGDSRLNIDFVAQKVNLGKRQFHRRLKSLTGLTPNQYYQEIRLQMAHGYILQGRFKTVKETCFAIGYNDVRYFSNLFIKRFGIKPSELRS